MAAVNGYPTSPGPALVDAVDHALRRVCHQLIYGVALSTFSAHTAVGTRFVSGATRPASGVVCCLWMVHAA